MAAQVLGGNGNVSYTNSTGQNVRLVINYLKVKDNPSSLPTLTFPGSSIELRKSTSYGKTLGYFGAAGQESIAYGVQRGDGGSSAVPPVPLEIALANGDTFSINAASSTDIQSYNIIIIPEAG